MRTFTLLVTILISLATYDCRGYSYPPPPASLHQDNRFDPIYGPPPPPASNTLPYVDHTCPEKSHQASIITAAVRTLGPPGKSYEAKLSPSNQINLGNGLIPPAINVPGNYPYENPATKHLPPPAQLQPQYQALIGGAAQHYVNGAATDRQPYTTYYNPLLTSHHSHQTPHPSLTPQAVQVFPNQGNHVQQQYFSSTTQNNEISLAGGTSNSPFGFHQPQITPVSTAGGSSPGVPGNYVTQSEVGQLDHYFEKQNQVGDTRAYSRLINTCYPDGHCEQQQLGAGQLDQRHQHVVATARARVQPISDKCRALAGRGGSVGQGSGAGQGARSNTNADSVNVGISLANSLQRPPNRRLYQYTELVIPRDPFN